MRICLTGTSNSILKGGIYTAFEDADVVTHFQNFSYGASSTVALGDHMQRITFEDFDFCVFDYNVNEEIFIRHRQSTTERTFNNLAAAIDSASRAGCQPIICILPSRVGLKARRNFEIEILEQLGPLGVPIFNSYDFVARMAETSQIEIDDFFMDQMHLHRFVGKYVGEVLLEYMQSVASKGRPQPAASSVRYDPLGFVPFSDLTITGDSHVEERATSLFQRSMVHLKPGAHVSIPLPGPAEVVGLTYNAAFCVGQLLEAESADVIYEVKPTAQPAAKRGLSLSSRPIPQPVAGVDRVDLRYIFEGELPEDHPDPSFEVNGFIVRFTTQTAPLHVATWGTGPVDFAPFVDLAKETDIATQIQEAQAAAT